MLRRLFGKDEQKSASDFKLKKAWRRPRTPFSLGRIGTIFQENEIADELWDELEEALIMGDVGMNTASELVKVARERVRRDAIKSTKGAYNVLKQESPCSVPTNLCASTTPRSSPWCWWWG